MGLTLYEKIWNAHAVATGPGGRTLLYIDRHLLHDGSFHAFEALRRLRPQGAPPGGLPSRRPTTTSHAGSRDHDRRPGPAGQGRHARGQRLGGDDPVCSRSSDERQGIVHVVGPEQGITQPGVTLVCGDSHTSTHGALGALAFGIGASEVAHVLATQSLWQARSRTMRVTVTGSLRPGVHAKDIILALIAKIGAFGGTGHTIEYAGPAIRALSHRGAHDDLQHVHRGRRARGLRGARRHDLRLPARAPARPAGRRLGPRARALAHARLRRGCALRPRGGPRRGGAGADGHVGHEPGARHGRDRRRARPCAGAGRDAPRAAWRRRCATWASSPASGSRGCRSTASSSARAPTAGSRTCARPRRIVRGRKAVVPALVVPGSGLVRRAAEAEGLDRVFIEAGFDWRESPAARCASGMNGDLVDAGERCASTSNRNFEGRQGKGARTHLMSPAMAAAAAVTGRITDVRKLLAGVRRTDDSPSPPSPPIAVPLDLVNVDTDQHRAGAIPAHAARVRLRELPLPRPARGGPGLRARPARLPRRADPGGRGELRLRLLARVRGVGAGGLRPARVDRALLRRHLLRELLQERRARDRAARRSGGRHPRAARARRRAPSSPSTCRRRRCACPTEPSNASRWTRSARSASLPASTRSTSPCATRRRSPPTRRGNARSRPGWRRSLPFPRLDLAIRAAFSRKDSGGSGPQRAFSSTWEREPAFADHDPHVPLPAARPHQRCHPSCSGPTRDARLRLVRTLRN